ncbi:hypothetical protein [Ruegeria sediminis]|nr:hypothetical protein [Ruegeria sediminis]
MVFAAFYIFALAIFVIGVVGLFGSPQDPLSGVYLIPLGLPWIWFIDVFDTSTWPYLAAAAPLVNLGLLALLCRLFRVRPSS